MANKEIFLNSGPHKVDLPKGTFDKSFRNHLTAKLGYLYPCLVEEAVAGSTYKIRPDMVFDLMPMAMPLQCRMRAHVSFFNVPFRILMKSYKDYVTRVGDHKMPYIARTEDWVTPGSLADYMGVPTAQFKETSGRVVNEFVMRGCLTNSFNQSIPSIQDSSNLDITPFSLDNFLSSYGSFVLAYTKPLLNPIVDSFSITYLSSSAFSSDNLVAGILVGSESTGMYNIYTFKGYNDTFRFHFRNSSPLSGTYNNVSSNYFHTLGSTIYNSYVLQIYLGESDIVKMNEWINQPGISVRLFIAYPRPSSFHPFGIGFGSLPSDTQFLQMLKAISSFTFEKSDDLFNLNPSVSGSSLSSLISPVTYPGLFGTVEADRHYFQVVDGEPPALPINALAFRAYEFIYNKYFRNLQVDKFYKNGEPSYNEYLTNDGDGADSTTPLELKRVPYEYDVFTTALPTPQAGFAPLVGVTTNNEDGMGILHMIPIVDGQPDPSQAYDIGVNYKSDTGDIIGVSNYSEVADKPSVARLQEAIDFGISINDIRNASAMQRLREKMAKAGFEYQPFFNEFYGTTPPIGEEFPEYLGGMTREIKIGKIQNTALSADHPLGEFAGVGGVAGSSRPIKVFVKETSYIIGVLWFSVTPTYSQMLPKHFLKFHPLDYFNPTFNAIGPQPIHTHEIAPLQLLPEDLQKVFGYQRPWYDYVSRVDECHGEFRTSMRHYLLQRLFALPPELTANFINIHSEELTDIWTYTVDTDKFFGYIDFDIKCKSPVARVSVPRIIG